MDIKRFFTTFLITGAIMLGILLIFKQFEATPKTNTPATAPASTTIAAATTLAQDPPATVTLGDFASQTPSKLKLTISNVGAGLDLVQINPTHYAADLTAKKPYTLLEAEPDVQRPFTTRHLTVDGITSDISAYHWHIASATSTEARLELQVTQKQVPIALITKVYTLDPQTYNITVNHYIQNLTNRPLKIAIDQLGPTDLAYESTQGDPRGFQAAGVNTAKKFVEPAQKVIAHDALKKSDKEVLGNFQGDNHLIWTANYNSFFTVIVRPEQPAAPAATTAPSTVDVQDGTIITPTFIGEAAVELLGQKTIPNLSDPWRVLGLNLQGSELTLAPQQSTQMPLKIFMGPKKRDLLLGDAESKDKQSTAFIFHLYNYRGIISFGTGMCAFCTFDPIVMGLLWLLDFVHKYITFGNYGIAIIILVIVVRLILHPLTRYSQVNMAITQKKMAGIQPEMEKIKKKYAKDKTAQNQAIMALYREKKVNPAGGIMGCLPMFLQMPIWIALYSGLRTDIDLRHASFLWISDLSYPDFLVRYTPSFNVPLLGILDGGKEHIFLLNLLPILLGFLFFFQMKFQAKTMPTPTDPQQAQTQKISQYMILIMPLFLYNAPSGLNLYIFASTIGGMFDTWLVRRHMRAKGILPNQPAAS